MSAEPAAPVPADCRRCGVCCHSDAEAYVWVTGPDWERLGPDAARLAHFIGNRAFMRMRAGHCAALEARRASDGGTEFRCSIYERRPEICRELGRGSPECLADLEAKAAGVARAHRG
jgi:Fe-S-cluster containining protein